MKYPNIREEGLKNKVAQDFFGKFDCTEIINDIDFAVKDHPCPSRGGELVPENSPLFPSFGGAGVVKGQGWFSRQSLCH